MNNNYTEKPVTERLSQTTYDFLKKLEHHNILLDGALNLQI